MWRGECERRARPACRSRPSGRPGETPLAPGPCRSSRRGRPQPLSRPGRGATAGSAARPVSSRPVPLHPGRLPLRHGGRGCPERGMRCPAAAERDPALLTVSAAGPCRASSHASPPVPAGWATGSGGSPAPRMRPAPAGSSHGAAAGGFARRCRSRRQRGRQPALPAPARPDGVGWRRLAPGEAQGRFATGLNAAVPAPRRRTGEGAGGAMGQALHGEMPERPA